MRKALFAGCIFAAACALPSAAHAQLAVECVNCSQEITDLINDAQVLAQWATQISDMENQITQQIAIVSSLTSTTNVMQLAPSLLQSQHFNPMQSFGNVPGMLQGSGNFGSLSAGSQYLQQNTLFAPTQNAGGMPMLSTVTKLFAARGQSLAANQAMTAQLLQNSDTSLAGLKQLQGEIDNQPDAKHVAALQARIAAFQGSIAVQHDQLAQADQFARAQLAVFNQREQQSVYCSAVSLYNDRKSLSGSGATIGGSGSCNGANIGAVAGAGVTASTGNSGANNGGVVQASLTGGNALDTMMSTDFGQAASDNATAMGINPEAVAATCVVESNCQNVAGSGTVSGPFQMTNGTFSQDLATAQQQNPGINVTGSKSDPTTEAFAASQELKTTANTLVDAGVMNPTVLDARGAYQFGQANGVALARASDNTALSSVLVGTSASTLAANGISSGETVGQWRSSVTAKLGASARAPVLLGTNT